jgi:glycosidase
MKRIPFPLLLFLGLAPLFLAPTCTKEKDPTPKPGMDWLKSAVIYEVNVRQFSPQGTFGGFMAHIPRLKNLGVDVLWFMPINPIGKQNRKGSLGSYYSVRDYTAVNPEFGSVEQFKMMVDMAHSLGMKVILDWVANHTAWDHPWITEHPDWYVKDAQGKIVTQYDWTDVAKLNFKNKAMRKAMTEAMKFWVRECGIDGFRCDVAFLVPPDYWEEARAELETIKPMFMLAEAEWHPDVNADPAAYTHKAFDANYHWDFMHTSAEINSGKKPLYELKNMLKRDRERFPAKTMRMTFLTNHDENSWNGTVNEKYGERWEPWSVLTYTLPGSFPLIYSGQEANLNHRLRFFDKDTISWADTGWNYWFRTMNGFKKAHPALWNAPHGGNFRLLNLSMGDTANIFAFKRELDSDAVWVFLNFSEQPVRFRLDDEQLPEKPEFLFNYPLQGDPRSGYFLPPRGYVIMSKPSAPSIPPKPSLPSLPE